MNLSKTFVILWPSPINFCFGSKKWLGYDESVFQSNRHGSWSDEEKLKTRNERTEKQKVAIRFDRMIRLQFDFIHRIDSFPDELKKKHWCLGRHGYHDQLDYAACLRSAVAAGYDKFTENHSLNVTRLHFGNPFWRNSSRNWFFFETKPISLRKIWADHTCLDQSFEKAFG